MNNYLTRILYLPWRFTVIGTTTLVLLFRLLSRTILPERRTLSTPVIIRQYFEDLGGSFIKVGQTLAMRPDFLPIEYCEVLSSLLDDVKPFRPSNGIEIIEIELQTPIDQLFRRIDPIPIASASFGQVYRAEDKQGNVLAIKVMRPGIERVVFADIVFLKSVSFFLSLVGIGARLGISHLIEELIEILEEELDYRVEARSIKLSWIAAQEIPHVRVPQVYEECSTRKVLTMEFLHGIWMKDILSEIRRDGTENLRDATDKPIDTVVLSRRISNIGMRQIFEYGYFHADPHAGNILIMANGEVGYVDFGIMGWIDKEFKNAQLDYFRAIVNGDIEDAVDIFTRILIAHTGADIEKFKLSLRPLLQIWIYSASKPDATLFEKSTALLLFESVELARQYHLHLPLNVMRYYRSLLIVEPILVELNPSYDVRASLRRYLMRYSMLEVHRMMQYDNVVERNLKASRLFLAAPDILESVIEYVSATARAPNEFKRQSSMAFRFAAEVFLLLAFVFLLLRIFFGVKNVGGIFGSTFTIDYRMVVIVCLYLSYRLRKFT
jgi:ubiquinone biosynthesis protein